IESERLYLCAKPNVDPFSEIPQVSKFCGLIRNVEMEWWAPDGLHWICGKKTYSRLPSNWGAICILGLIQPFFFLLPKQDGADLGVPL
ncbi:ENR1 protein, partial [Mystacornis crossleyi]|nr:ENR1 protein [Mystacornis crossleyi]NXS24226.1 ENR1 protein [Mystacornis crossleyi]